MQATEQDREALRVELAREALREPELRGEMARRKQAYAKERDGAPKCPSCSTRVEPLQLKALRSEWEQARARWQVAEQARRRLAREFCRAQVEAEERAGGALRLAEQAAHGAEQRAREASESLALLQKRQVPADHLEQATRTRDALEESAAVAANELDKARADHAAALEALEAALAEAMAVPDAPAQ
jgi:hypothetical protein